MSPQSCSACPNSSSDDRAPKSQSPSSQPHHHHSTPATSTPQSPIHVGWVHAYISQGSGGVGECRLGDTNHGQLSTPHSVTKICWDPSSSRTQLEKNTCPPHNAPQTPHPANPTTPSKTTEGAQTIGWAPLSTSPPTEWLKVWVWRRRWWYRRRQVSCPL